MYKYLLIIIIVLLLLTTTTTYLFQSHPDKQSLTEFFMSEQPKLNVLLTKSYYNQKRITLGVDLTDINERKATNMLTNIFPFKVKNVGFENLLDDNDILLVPQIYNTYLNAKQKTYYYVASLYAVCLTMILPINSKVKSYRDFEDITIGTLNVNHASDAFISVFSYALNLNLKIKYCSSYQELYNLWKNKEINAIFMLVSHPNEFVKLFSYQEEIRFFDWETLFKDINLNRILSFHFPNLKQIQIPIKTYRFFKTSQYFKGYGFHVNLIANANVADEYVYDLLKTIYINYNKIKNNLESAYLLSPSWMSFCPPNISYHNGAREFYKDVNLISEESNDCYLLNDQCTKKTRKTIYNIIEKRIGII